MAVCALHCLARIYRTLLALCAVQHLTVCAVLAVCALQFLVSLYCAILAVCADTVPDMYVLYCILLNNNNYLTVYF